MEQKTLCGFLKGYYAAMPDSISTTSVLSAMESIWPAGFHKHRQSVRGTISQHARLGYLKPSGRAESAINGRGRYSRIYNLTSRGFKYAQ